MNSNAHNEQVQHRKEGAHDPESCTCQLEGKNEQQKIDCVEQGEAHPVPTPGVWLQHSENH